MTNPIDSQTDLITAIAQYVHDSAPSDYEEAICVFEYFKEEDGSWSVGSQFSYSSNGKSVGDYLKDSHDKVPDLVAQLHGIMHSHTGGQWNAFVLSVKNGGAVNAKFKYD
ncbi:MAG: hypothetical protein K2X79_06700 [Burkholderiaceae bacterium]|nr:hypothetical protein [Burkholderiaceae bacterium]